MRQATQNIIAALLTSCAAFHNAAAAPLDRPEEVEALCAYSAPFPASSPDSAESEGGVARALAGETASRASFTAIPGSDHDAFSRYDADEEIAVQAVDAMQVRHYVETRGRVSLSTWSMRLDASVFRVVHREGERTLRIALQEVAPITDGSQLVRWDGTRELIFEMSEPLMQRIRQQGEAGELALEVEATLAGRSRYDRQLCELSDEGHTVVPLILISGQLVETASGDTLAMAQTAQSAGAACSRAARDGAETVTPVVRVVGMESAGEAGLSTVEATLLRAWIESRLHRCYFEGIERNAAMRGAMVFSFSLSEEGELNSVGVALDAMDAPELVRCAASTLDSFAMPRSAGASELSIQLSVVFRND